jgi:short-subunit dehydrogenase
MLLSAAVVVLALLSPKALVSPGAEPFWRGKRVLIAGASSGLGAALATEVSSRGCAALCLAARRSEQLVSVAASCSGPDVSTVSFDACASSSNIESVADEAVEKLGGRCDVLLYCAGVGQRTLAVETDAAAHAQLMGANFEGAVSLTRCLLPRMLSQGTGSIAVISSVQGRFGQPYRSSYAAAKAAVFGYFDALRAEVCGRGVQVTVVAPGYIATNHSASAFGASTSAPDASAASGIQPAELAVSVADAVAAGTPELVASQPSGRVAMWLRTIWPRAFFRIMAAKVKSQTP